MSKTQREKVYVDSCIFLKWLVGDFDTVEQKEAVHLLFSKYDAGDISIVTSTMTISEVAYSSKDKLTLDTAFADALKRRNCDQVAVTPQIAELASAFIRSIQARKSLSLKPADAIHIATATLLDLQTLYTCDPKMIRLSRDADFPLLNICEPPPPLKTNLFSPLD